MRSNRLLLFILTSIFLLNCTERSTEKNPGSEVKTLQMAQLEYEIPSLLGEGAFWNYKSGELYWIDIDGKKLHIYNPETKTNRSFPTPSRIGTVVPQTDTTAVIALEDGIYIINTENGNIKALSEVEKEMTFNRFNDGKCDPNGNLWVGSMHLEQMIPMGSVYKISETGETTKMIDSVTISNGIVWTKDASAMYYIDTPTQNIQVFDFDTATSTLSNERTAVRVPKALGFPDGMSIDEEDMLWVGLWNGNAIGRFDPKTGKLISKIEVPAHNVTSCAFGGKNLDKLYITTASVDMTEEEKANYPLAGSLFVADPGVKGVHSEFFGKNN
ncbi:MAG: SMP-30/gluconolactonase/LRE family protein [Bacteroidetes bacterium]|nr:SMP-30/gluconolactonase/LRE family protein [Bacteroidota bacterium]